MRTLLYSHIALIILFIIPHLNAKAQSFSWAQGITGLGSSSPSGTGVAMATVDAVGNIYTVGSFGGTADFDGGPGTYNLTAVSNLDMFVMKEDPSGNLIWVKQVVGLSSGVCCCLGRGIDVDQNGNVFVTGGYIDSFDFDPGPSVYKLNSFGGPHSFILKLDATGNFVWVKDIGTQIPSINVQLNAAKRSKNGHLFFAALVNGNGTTPVDVDPGPGIFNITPNLGDLLLEKLDSNGDFMWAKLITGTNGKTPTSVDFDSMLNIFISGRFLGSADFDPSPGVFTLTATAGSFNDYDIFVAKYDSAGNFNWAKKFGNTSDDYGNGGAVDRFGNILVTGYFGGTVDFDPGPGSFNLTSNSTKSMFTLKLRNNGDFAWAKMAGTPVGIFYGGAVTTDSIGNVYTALGLPNSCDINPGTGVFTVPAGVAVQKLDSSGNFVWGAGWQGGIPGWVGLDHNNSVYTTGTFSGSNKDFDPGAGTFLLSGSNQGSGFIHKMCQGVPPVVSITASDTVGCTGDTVTLTAATLPGTYHWSRNNITLPDTTVSIKITTAGTYAVRVSGSCPSIGMHNIFFYSKANPVISLPPGPMSVSIGQQASVTASVLNPGPGSTINWYKNGVLFTTTTATGVSYTKAAGTDTIVAVVFGPGNPCFIPDTSNALIIDAVNSISEKATANAISVYPNPSSGVFTFSSATAIENIEITDLTGKVVLSSSPNTGKLTIDMNRKAAGVYFYSVMSGESVLRGKIVIQ